MSSVNNSLLKFPTGLQLYLQHCGKRLDGITLRQGLTPVFDVTTSNAEKNRKYMVPDHLLNYFRRHHVIKSEGGYMTYSCNEMYIPNLLAVLFVAEGARKGSSLQQLLDEKMSIEGLAQIGKGPTLEERLTEHFAKEKAASQNTVHYPDETAPVRVSERVAVIESRVSSNSSSSSSASVTPVIPVVVRANLTASPTPCRTCKNVSTFFVDTGGDWDCINCINSVKSGSLTTAQRTLLERLGPDPVVKINDSFEYHPIKYHPFIGLYKDGTQCHSCDETHTLVFDRLYNKPWSYCSGCAGFEIVQRPTVVAAVATEAPSTAEVLDKLRARKSAQRLELVELRAISNITIRCKKLQGRIDHHKALISTSSAEDLKKKEAALTDELAALEKTAADARVVRVLEKKVEEARKVVEPAEDLKKKEQALTEELAALETIAAEVKAVRELEKKVIEARKILQEPECK